MANGCYGDHDMPPLDERDDCTPIPVEVDEDETREIEAGALLPADVACAYGEACEFRARLERERAA